MAFFRTWEILQQLLSVFDVYFWRASLKRIFKGLPMMARSSSSTPTPHHKISGENLNKHAEVIARSGNFFGKYR